MQNRYTMHTAISAARACANKAVYKVRGPRLLPLWSLLGLEMETTHCLDGPSVAYHSTMLVPSGPVALWPSLLVPV